MNVYEMEGFLRGKCMPRDILVNESTAEYLVRKLNEATTVKAERDALERQLLMSEAKCKGYFSDAAAALIKCDALAVENAAQGAALSLISECYGLSPHIQSMCAVETPATSAALAAVRLQAKIEGVEAAANRVGIVSLRYKPGQKQELIKAIGRDVLQYADELREAK
ncbi:hypothetical protein [Serratia sp. 1D1416]|uniref:hypothetical protein n=1 Tax=Serratia sp. 1D1416 TaxID=2447890 RepID=UPI001013CAC8|nr:hypothetical protein [Serratia sp. 1D1416]